MRPTLFGPFRYPLGGDGDERPLFACWILAMVGFLAPLAALCTVVPLVGYLVRVLEASANGDPAPRFGVQALALVRQGLGSVAVTFCYLIGPLVALLATVYGVTTNDPTVDTLGAFSLYVGSTVVLCLFLLAAFLVPAGVLAYVEAGAIRAAFSRRRIRPVAGHAAYFTRWMAGSLTLVTGVAVANVSLQVHRVGPVIASLVAVYGAFVTTHLWGQGIGTARERA